MPRIDESDQDVGNEPPFVARKVVIKKGQNPKLDYSFADELGRGRFGTVLMCTEKKTGLKLAAKFVSTRHKEERENVEREVDIMKLLQHRRLLQLYDVYDDGSSEMCIITELISGGELFERVIDDDFELTEKVCAIFMRQICEGVEYMHQKFIMHLDMKPENVLCVTRTGNRIKLIDFGLARRFDPNHKLQVMFGTPDFAAPEVLSYERVTPAADMWSVGVICYVLLSGLSPFMGNSDLETMTNVTKAIYDFDDESFDPISQEAKDFIAKLLIKDPSKRLKPQDCLNHKWLAKKKTGTTTKLSKTKLKKYVVRRRWQKAVTAIMALRRMGANLSLTGGSGGKSPLGSPSVRSSSKPTSSSTTRTSTSRVTTSSPSSNTTAPATRSSYTSSMSTSSSSTRSTASSRPPIKTTSTTTYSSPSSLGTTYNRGGSSSSSTSNTTSSALSSSRLGGSSSPTPSAASRVISSTSSSSYKVTSSTTRRRF